MWKYICRHAYTSKVTCLTNGIRPLFLTAFTVAELERVLLKQVLTTVFPYVSGAAYYMYLRLPVAFCVLVYQQSPKLQISYVVVHGAIDINST